MRLPTKAEIEAADSERAQDFYARSGLSANPTLEQVFTFLAKAFSETGAGEMMKDLTSDSIAIVEILRECQSFKRVAASAVASRGDTQTMECLLASIFQWGMQTGYAMGQSDALELASSLNNSVDK